MKLKIEDFVSDSSTVEEKRAELIEELKEEFDQFYDVYESGLLADLLPPLGKGRLTELVVRANQDGVLGGDTEFLYQQIASSSRLVDRTLKEHIAEFQLKADNFTADGGGRDDFEDEEEVEYLDEGDDDDYEDDENDELEADAVNLDDIEEAEAGEEDEDDEENSDEELAAQALFGKDPFGTRASSQDSGLDGDPNTAELDDDEEEQSEEEEVDGDDTGDAVKESEFFKIGELEKFLDAEDKKEAKRIAREETGVGEASDEDEMALDDPSLVQDGKGLKYEDFFGSSEDAQPKKRKVKFDEAFDEVPAKKTQIPPPPEEQQEGESKSAYEKRLEKYRQKIAALEDASVAEKPWQLTGEVSARKRPENSMLEEIVDFDSNARPPPIITSDKTETIENLIIQRIKDVAFDDVERKFRPTEQPFEYHKRILLDQDKSKLSLAEVYEKEYLEQLKEEKSEEKNPQHEEIRALMKDIFHKLDALSHYNLAPAPPKPEMTIINNTPAIQMEEQVPIAVADSALLAPEEIHKVKATDEKASTERTKTDKLRARRKKKQKMKAIAAVEAKKLDPNSREKAMIDLKKASRAVGSKKVTIVKDTKHTEKSKMTTTSFFQQLNDQAASNPLVDGKKKKKKTVVTGDATKFKL